MHAQELLATAAVVAAEEPRAAWLGGLTNHEDAFLRLYRMLLALHAAVATIPYSTPRSSAPCTASASAGPDCTHNVTPRDSHARKDSMVVVDLRVFSRTYIF